MATRITQNEYEEKFVGCKRTKALKHALEIRKFEIDLYWKRATYFWTFIGGAFAGFGAVQASSMPTKADLSVPLACLGLVFSFGWFCVNKGSKQWQENWENHVDLLEDNEIGPIYRIVLLRDKPKGIKELLIHALIGPAQLSVSRINQLISLYVTFIWVPLLVHAMIPPYASRYALLRYGIEILSAAITCVGFLSLGRTSFGPHRPIAEMRETQVKSEKAFSSDIRNRI